MGKAPGPSHKPSQEQRQALAAVVESGPDPAIRRGSRLAEMRAKLAAGLVMPHVNRDGMNAHLAEVNRGP